MGWGGGVGVDGDVEGGVEGGGAGERVVGEEGEGNEEGDKGVKKTVDKGAVTEVIKEVIERNKEDNNRVVLSGEYIIPGGHGRPDTAGRLLGGGTHEHVSEGGLEAPADVTAAYGLLRDRLLQLHPGLEEEGWRGVRCHAGEGWVMMVDCCGVMGDDGLCDE